MDLVDRRSVREPPNEPARREQLVGDHLCGGPAFERYYGNGGGLVAIHAAIQAELDGQFLTDALGTRASGETAVQAGTIKVADRFHDATTQEGDWFNAPSAIGPATDPGRSLRHAKLGIECMLGLRAGPKPHAQSSETEDAPFESEVVAG